jgi:hypothetical protein
LLGAYTYGERRHLQEILDEPPAEDDHVKGRAESDFEVRQRWETEHGVRTTRLPGRPLALAEEGA